MSVRHFLHQTLADRCSATQSRHVRLAPGLVDEDQAMNIVAGLIGSPLGASCRNIGPILLRGMQRLFLKERPIRRSAMSTADTLHWIPKRSCSCLAVASGC
jgi:hypothetical protein